MNYNEEMKKIIKNKKGNKLLLHSCCGPCSTSVIERLKDDFDITVIYYNPNIEPFEEYEKRKKEQLRILNIYGIKYIDTDYVNEKYRTKVKGYENERENGFRCHLCYELRLEKTAIMAKESNFDYFGTTLTVSPYKNSKVINALGLKLEEKYKISYLLSDFKKEDGYKKSIELSKKYDLYRQDYCGCLFSKGESMKKNDSGFTLIELLAVVVILGVISLLLFTDVGSIFLQTKNKINDINKQNISEAAETLGATIINCVMDDEGYDVLNLTGDDRNCLVVKNMLLSDSGINLKIADLRKIGLLDELKENCDGTINLKSDSDYNFTVTFGADVKCGKEE